MCIINWFNGMNPNALTICSKCTHWSCFLQNITQNELINHSINIVSNHLWYNCLFLKCAHDRSWWSTLWNRSWHVANLSVRLKVLFLVIPKMTKHSYYFIRMFYHSQTENMVTHVWYENNILLYILFIVSLNI